MTAELINTLIPIVVIGLIALIVGILIGYLVSGILRSSPQNNSSNSEKSVVEVIRVSRARNNRQMIVDIENTKYSSIEKMSPRIRAIFQQTLNELKTWSEEREKPEPKPSNPLASTTDSKIVSPLPQKTTAVNEPNSIAGIKPPSLDLRDIISRAIVPDVKQKQEEFATSMSIASQIDEILQEKLPLSPLKNRSIHLIELPDQGLVVEVDGISFQGVGDIADLEVKQLIQECVTEWERNK